MSQGKLSVPEWCSYQGDMAPAEFYGKLKAMGFQGVEMVDTTHWDAVRAAGLEILNLIGPGMTEGLNYRENHATLLPELEKAIEQAAENNIGHVIIFSGNRKGQADAEGLENLIDAVKQVAPMAEKQGVTLVMEMLNSQDHADYQADSSSYGFELVRAVNSPNVKVIYDIYHMTKMGENPLKDVLENMDLIAHLHVAEVPKRGKPVAGGNIDYGPLVKEIQNAGYDGYWGFEFLCVENVMDELSESVALFQGYFRQA